MAENGKETEMTTKKVAYSIESLKEVNKNKDIVKDILNDKIAELRECGFCIDYGLNENGETILDSIERRFCDPKSKFYNPDYRMEDNFEILREYVLNGENHVFVHVKPTGFSFQYIDFENMGDVFNSHRNNVVYANSFYGIYIRNDFLRMHDLVQIDIYKKYFRICPYNIYDGGNDLLFYSDAIGYVGVGGDHNGAIFTKWEDFIDTKKRVMDFSDEAYRTRIKHWQDQIDDETKKHDEFQKRMQFEIDQLLKLG